MAKGGKVVLVVDREPVESGTGLLTIKLEPVPESWEGLTSVLVPQALTLALIERLGSRYVRLNTTVQ
jgi:glucosamine--fructose-6-phosphate aminotransferase (isomerizing)